MKTLSSKQYPTKYPRDIHSLIKYVAQKDCEYQEKYVPVDVPPLKHVNCWKPTKTSLVAFCKNVIFNI